MDEDTSLIRRVYPLSADEQLKIQGLTPLEREVFADYLLDHYSTGPDYYEGWTRYDFMLALFAGPRAFREALEAVKGK